MSLSVSEKSEIFSRPPVVLAPGVSELSVLKSAAGYYVGRTLDGMPYSRESGYFNTEKKSGRGFGLCPQRNHSGRMSGRRDVVREYASPFPREIRFPGGRVSLGFPKLL